MQDISRISYEDWLNFLFLHPPLEFDSVTKMPFEIPWYFQDEWEYHSDSGIAVERLTHLFLESERLVDKYATNQIDLGFWFIPSANGLFGRVLDPKVPVEARIECVARSVDLYERLFNKFNIGSSAVMWWDSVVTYCTFGDMNIATDLSIFEAICRSVAAVGRLDSAVSKEAAVIGTTRLEKVCSSTGDGRLRDILSKTR